MQSSGNSRNGIKTLYRALASIMCKCALLIHMTMATFRQEQPLQLFKILIHALTQEPTKGISLSTQLTISVSSHVMLRHAVHPFARRSSSCRKYRSSLHRRWSVPAVEIADSSTPYKWPYTCVGRPTCTRRQVLQGVEGTQHVGKYTPRIGFRCGVGPG